LIWDNEACAGAGSAFASEEEASGFGFLDGSITSKAKRAMMRMTITKIPSGLGDPVASSYMKLRTPRIADPKYGIGIVYW